MQATRATSQRGTILLMALFFVGVVTSLTFSLIWWAGAGVRCYRNASEAGRAEAAAISGVELVAARFLRSGTLVTEQLKERMGSDQTISVDVQTSSPNVTATGHSHGVAVTLKADLALLGGDLDYALASFVGECHFHSYLHIFGPVYLGDPVNPVHDEAHLEIYDGDLDAVRPSAFPWDTITFPSEGHVQQVSAVTEPAFDTLPFRNMNSEGALTVFHYYGSTTLEGLTLDGIVVFHPSAGGTVKLIDCTINGTLVVLRGALPSSPDKFKLHFERGGVIHGGTSKTGNLAILAPTSEWEVKDWDGWQIDGVIHVGQVTDMKATEITGCLWSRDYVRIGDNVTIDRPADFLPDCPLGLTLERDLSQARAEITWLGH